MPDSKISFVTVSDDRWGRKDGKYSESQDQIKDLLTENSHLGISNLFFWKFRDILKTDFYLKNKDILDKADPAMNGRCYKPFVISESLRSIEDGDFLIYNDVSPEHWRNVSLSGEFFDTSIIKDLCDSNGGILSTESIWTVNSEVAPHTHEFFTTDKCMETMGMKSYEHSIQHASGMMVFRKSKDVVDFVEEWLKWNVIPECASLSSLDGATNYMVGENKFGHRHDQSISGLLINSRNGKILKNVGGHNFITYCRKNYPYEFIETNQGPSEYIYRPISDGSIRKESRNPNISQSSSSYPLNL